jgi:proline dehydrogenase
MLDYPEMEGPDSRWALPDRARTVAWCRKRNAEGIRCILHALGEYATDPGRTSRAVEDAVESLRVIEQNSLDASLSLKLSDLGALFDSNLCLQNVRAILGEAASLGVGIEIDMEGRPFVDRTMAMAVACAGSGRPLTLTLQAYLDRTSADLAAAGDHNIRIRLVKGAYMGDLQDFFAIQTRFRELFVMLRHRPDHFTVGTHDPDLLGWITDQRAPDPRTIEFGFLMGLADQTKRRLVDEGWQVSEYVPFGPSDQAYVARRDQYLKTLELLGRRPLP